ncbi:MAG: hypothetical protein AAB401_04155, partial [Acidobacteriota bacterium]
MTRTNIIAITKICLLLALFFPVTSFSPSTLATRDGNASVTNTPTMAGQWTQTAGPYGGSIYALLANGNDLFAGTGTGVFRSTNNGQSWTAANKGITGSTILSLAAKDGYVFAGTLDRGVFRSSNNGKNWTQINNGLTSTYIKTLTVSGNKIFLGAIGVFVSTDNGETWTKLNVNNGINSFAVKGATLFAGTTSKG